MMRHNDVEGFIETELDDEGKHHLLAAGHKVSASGSEKEQKRREDLEKVRWKRELEKVEVEAEDDCIKGLEAIPLTDDLEWVQSKKTTIKDLDPQLDAYRHQYGGIPLKSHISLKSQKVEHLMKAIERKRHRDKGLPEDEEQPIPTPPYLEESRFKNVLRHLAVVLNEDRKHS